jgi:Asp-tRNA(Asn)/Glu-tRNA(Gln) amidotransferase A subunit family amidase
MSIDSTLDRRRFMATFSAMGLGSTLFPGVLWARVSEGADVTKETIACAEQISGVSFTDEQRAMMVETLKRQQRGLEALHKIPLDNGVAPAILFDPIPPGVTLAPPPKGPMVRARVPLREVPGGEADLAYMSVAELSRLVQARKVTSTRLTELYLKRLERHDPTLHAVITLTADRARRQAKAMDEEITRGKYRGPLHGIPWGAKDLLAVKGYKTTWGAGPYKDQVIDADATVVQRLDAAGAVLVAKLTLGELAQGDRWFGERTRNPWWPEQGSSGSSAGPGSTVAAGLVGFAIGTETLGSISSPSTRNGVTGLRPTFGRVPRTGAMALSWTMDKIGPMCRSAEDCALVLAAIHGPDGYDRAVKDLPFTWNALRDVRKLRVGYVKATFDLPERDKDNRLQHATKRHDDAALEALRASGVTLVPVELPEISGQAMSHILTAEAGAAFEELTLSGKVNAMVQQGAFDWPNTFRAAQFIPAVDYVNANRVRTLAMQKWWALFEKLDAIVVPTSGSSQLQATNLTGNPAVIVPNGFIEAPPLQPPAPVTASTTPAAPADTGRRAQPPTPSPRPQVPVSLTFLGPLYREDLALALAHHYQGATEWHRKRPPGF